MTRLLVSLFICLGLQLTSSYAYDQMLTADTLVHRPTIMSVHNDTTLNQREKIKEYGNIFVRFVKAFDEIDTTYIIPNRYNWAFMMQNTNSYEFYSLHSSRDNQRLLFSPNPSFRFGPYLGWRWIFLGYTFDINSFGKGHKSQKTEFELSIYSSMIGCDLIYRRTGNDFRIHDVNGFGDYAKEVEGRSTNGIRLQVTGANIYYVFNHKRFSYPAAFAQSTVQRRSCGSWMLGLSVTQHLMEFDYNKLPLELTSNPLHPLSENFKFNKINYMDYSISGGYGYNWVFKKNWLLNFSLMPAIGYKHTKTKDFWQDDKETESLPKYLRPLHLNNFNFNCTLRAGLVWNTTKYFGGLSLIVHNYNYNHSKLQINNAFGTLNLYMGFNFHKRKQYR